MGALDEHGNTVGIAATGFGKTIALSGLIGEHLKRGASKAIVLQHRDELLNQNRSKLLKVVPDAWATVYNADRKDVRGNVVFASEPTIRRPENLARMPAFDLAVIDECHHVAAPGYQRIIAALREQNSDIRIFGTTATIVRGDKASLKSTFTNVGDIVPIRELVSSGHLVRPRAFVIDVGIQGELRDLRTIAGEIDQEQAAGIFNRPVVNDAVVQHWRERAGDRVTMAFCSTVEHATDVASTFREHGVAADVVHGELSKEERRRRFAAFERGDTQVLTNVAIATEGYDFPPISCIVYLKMSSYKSTFIQAVGRALRTIDPEIYPGVVKTDAIILDFGNTAKSIGNFDLDADLSSDRISGDAPCKSCPECGQVVPIQTRQCDHCGHEWAMVESDLDAEPISDFIMSEVDLLARSNFRWIDPFGEDTCLMAAGFESWGGIYFWNGHWHAIGGKPRSRPKYLGVGERTVAMALADDWLNEHESDNSAHKTRRWLSQPATDRQIEILNGSAPVDPLGLSLSKYQASCLLSHQFNKDAIKRLVMR